jgi:D-alanyl-D-alanine carboxypeptidase
MATSTELSEIVGRSSLNGVALVRVADSWWQRGDVDAPFVIYSITKSVIAAAVSLLADRFELEFDASVCTLIGDDRFDVSVRQLLTHTSGIPDYGRLREYHAAVCTDPSQPWTDETFLEHALATGPDFPPGQGWEYSNTGYLLVRRVLDEHGGLASFLPALGFTAARVAEGLADLDDAVPARSAQIGEGLHAVAGRYHPAWVGHRTLVTSARELERFWGQLPAALLDRESLVSIGSDVRGYVRPSYGLGVQADPESALGLTIGHGGGGPGYSTAAFAAPEHDAVAVVLEPSEGFPAQELALDLLGAAIS